MTREQIEQAANEYSGIDNGYSDCAKERVKEAFISGYDAGRPEIDALTAENEKLHKEIVDMVFALAVTFPNSDADVWRIGIVDKLERKYNP